MHFGLAEKTIIVIQVVLAKYSEIDKVVIYGYRAMGNYKNGSDIDLTLYGDNLSQQLLRNVFDDLDELLLPYMIDLSVFADINNPTLREHIERVGKVFYARDNKVE